MSNLELSFRNDPQALILKSNLYILEHLKQNQLYGLLICLLLNFLFLIFLNLAYLLNIIHILSATIVTKVQLINSINRNGAYNIVWTFSRICTHSDNRLDSIPYSLIIHTTDSIQTKTSEDKTPEISVCVQHLHSEYTQHQET